MTCEVVVVMTSGPRKRPMIGVSGENEYLTVILAMQPGCVVPVHASVSAAFRNSIHTPLAPLGGHEVELASIFRDVACWIARARISAVVWLTIAVRPPSRAAFEIAL